MRTKAFIRALPAIPLAVLVFGCGASPLAAGEAAFKKGQYPLAKQSLASLEGESRTWDGPCRARYALYRGLTLAALGDHGRAAPWLEQARALEGERPGALTDDERRRLDAERDANPVR